MKKKPILITALCLSLSLNLILITVLFQSRAACGTSHSEVTAASTEPTVLEFGSLEGIDLSITEKDGMHIPTIQELYDGREPEQSMAIAPGGMIPQGCAYFIYAENPEDTVRLVPGDPFPEQSKTGDTLTTPYFKYIYDSKLEIRQKPSGSTNGEPSKMSGWRLQTHYSEQDKGEFFQNEIAPLGFGWGEAIGKNLFPEDMYMKSYDEPLFGKINGRNVLSAESLYQSNPNLEKAPDFPNEIMNMDRVFLGCQKLRESPKLPESTVTMMQTFSGCSSIRRSPEIPKNVWSLDSTFFGCINLVQPPNLEKVDAIWDMYGTFEGCLSLKSFPVIPETVCQLTNCFYGCMDISGNFVLNSQEPGIVSMAQYRNIFSGCNLEGITIKGTSPALNDLHRMYPELKRGY